MTRKMFKFNKGDLIHTSQIGQFKEDEIFVVAVSAKELFHSQAYSTDVHGDPMIVVVKQWYYETIQYKSPRELIEMWHHNRRETCPIFVYPEFEFKLYPQNNAEHARLSLEVFE